MTISQLGGPTTQPGGQVTKDPASTATWTHDWRDGMAAEARLVTAGVFTVTAVTPREAPVSLVVDHVTLLAGNQSVQFQVRGGRRGTLYNIAHAITTNEVPAQQWERSFQVLVEDL